MTMRSIRRLNPGRPKPEPQVTFELAPGVSMPEDEALAHILDYCYMPGENIQVRGNDRPIAFEPESEAAYEARSALAGKPVTVTETILEVLENNHVLTWHKLDGVDGRFLSNGFTSPGLTDQPYGVIIEHDGDMWLVPMSDVDGHVSGDPRKLTGLGRPLRKQILGFIEREPTVRDLLSTDGGGPICGEFFINSVDDGATWTVVAAPWTAGTSEAEVETALAALAAPALKP
jgi:hypothetical protein